MKYIFTKLFLCHSFLYFLPIYFISPNVRIYSSITFWSFSYFFNFDLIKSDVSFYCCWVEDYIFSFSSNFFFFTLLFIICYLNLFVFFFELNKWDSSIFSFFSSSGISFKHILLKFNSSYYRKSCFDYLLKLMLVWLKRDSWVDCVSEIWWSWS